MASRIRLVSTLTPIAGRHAALRNASRAWSDRRSLLLRIGDGRAWGLGEATPLPGYSSDRLDMARQDLEAIDLGRAEPLFEKLPPPGSPPGVELRAHALETLRSMAEIMASPAARFAFETALLDLLGQRSGVPLWRWLTPEPVTRQISTSAVIDPLASDALERAEDCIARGLTTLKLKLGRDFTREFEFAENLRKRHPKHDLALRFDANRAWRAQDAEAHLAMLANLEPEYVEEPCAEPLSTSALSAGVSLAADESLQGLSPSAWGKPSVSKLVLKPMALGGFTKCLEWAELADRRGLDVVVSHLFDGPIALGACSHLAFAIQSPHRAVSLGRHDGLRAWTLTPPDFVRDAAIAVPTKPGLGMSGASSAIGLASADFSLASVARDAPDHPALVFDDQTLSFAALASLTARARAWLDTRDAVELARTTGRPVAWTAQPTPASLALLYACIDAGIPALPLHPRSSDAERARVLDEIEAACVVPDGVTPLHEDEAPLGGSEPIDPEADLAWIMTSGSTARPRAVRLSRRAFAASAAASEANLGFQPDDRWLLSIPFAHVGGLSVLIRCLLARKTVVVSTSGTPSNPAAFARWLGEHGVTLLSLVPTQLTRLLEAPDFALPPSVRAILLGGAAAPAPLLERAKERGVPVLQTYGLTEACSQVATADARAGASSKLRALSGVELKVAPDGSLCLRSPVLFSGYAGKPEGNGTSSEGPLDEEGWFRTSDLGRIDEAGNLEVLGRRDNVIISGGENVTPELVEAVLLDHPRVHAACVVGAPDDEWGARIVAVIVASGIEAEGLDAWVRSRLSAFQRPRRWLFVSELPHLGGGKVDRRAVASLAADTGDR